MSKLTVGLLLGLWLGLVLLLGLAACRGDEVADTAVCDFTNQTAVTLNLLDENGDPARLVQLRYRVDDGAWQELPESVNGTAVLQAGPGTYQIHVETPGYAPDEITIVVPEPAAGSCTLVPETATLPLSLPVCPSVDLATLTIEIDSVSETVQVTAVANPGGVQSLTCDEETDGNCHSYSLTLPGAGELLLAVENLGGIGPMQINDGFVSYALNESQLALRQNSQQQSVTANGAHSLVASLSVTLDEAGCPLADFRTLETETDPNVNDDEPFPELRIVQLSNLTVTDMAATACQATPELFPVQFEAILPTGTALADVSVQVFADGDWQTATCEMANGRFLCSYTLPNPLIGQSYAYKVVADDEEYVGSSLPFDNVCLIFE